MTARAIPYPPGPFRIRIGRTVWGDAVCRLREYGARDSEGILFLGGLVADGDLVVTGLYALGHAAQGDQVVVSPAEARWLLRTLRARDEKLIAQIHSHRVGQFHSAGDDRWATSFHEGFVSIVVPRFGIAVEAPSECGIFEYRAGSFKPWTESQVRARLRVLDDIVERDPERRSINVGENGWATFVRKLKSIAARLH